MVTPPCSSLLRRGVGFGLDVSQKVPSGQTKASLPTGTSQS